MHHLETLIQAIPPAVFAAGNLPSVNSGPLSDSAPSPIPSFMYPTHTYPLGVPPPSLHVFPLTNPSTHFTKKSNSGERQKSPNSAFHSLMRSTSNTDDQLAEETSRLSLSASYLYYDDEGYTRWQGETSGLPLLDLLVERHNPNNSEMSESKPRPDLSSGARKDATWNTDWFPNRTLRRTDVNPETLWRLITSFIVPELMDRCRSSLFRLLAI